MKLAFYARYALRTLRRGRERTVLAVICIAFGIMSLVAMQMLASSIHTALIPDPRAELGGDGTLSRPDNRNLEADLAKLKADGTIKVYSLLAPSQSRVLKVAGSGRSNSSAALNRALGVDPAVYPLVGQILLSDGISLSQALARPDTAAITRDLADGLNLRVGDHFTLSGDPTIAPVRLEVSGIVQSTPDYTGGSVFFSLDTARRIEGHADVATRANIIWSAKGPQKDSLSAAGWEVATPDDVIRGRANVAETFDLMLKGAGILGLLIGGIGIASTIQAMLARRTLEIATLKTHGYCQRDLLVLFGVETAVLGLVGGAVGAGAGIVVASQLVRLLGRIGFLLLDWTIDPKLIAGGILIGAATAVVFGLHAIVRASAVRPAVLLRGQPVSQGWRSRLTSAALYVLLGALFYLMSSLILSSILYGVGVVVGALAGILFLGVVLGAAYFTLVRLPLPTPRFLRLTRNNLKRQQVRALLVMVALFTGIAVTGFAGSIIFSARERIPSLSSPTTGGNLAVFATQSDGSQIEAQLKEAGLQEIHAIYGGRASITGPDGSPIPGLTSLEGPAVNDATWGIKITAGGWPTEPGSVLVPDRFGELKANLKPGDDLTIAPQGGAPMRVRVAGLYRQGDNLFSLNSGGSVLVTSQAPLNLPAASSAVTYIGQAPPAELAAKAASLQKALPNAVVFTADDLIGVVNRIYTNLFTFVVAMTGLALAAGGVLIINSVALAMLERQREVGILKAVGFTSRRVLQTVLLENAFLGLLSGVFAMTFVRMALEIMNRLRPAAELTITPPQMVGFVFLSVVIALVCACVVAWHPTHVRPLEVLRNE